MNGVRGGGGRFERGAFLIQQRIMMLHNVNASLSQFKTGGGSCGWRTCMPA